MGVILDHVIMGSFYIFLVCIYDLLMIAKKQSIFIFNYRNVLLSFQTQLPPTTVCLLVCLLYHPLLLNYSLLT